MATMLPTGMLPGLLSPEQEAAVAQQARQNALLNFGLQALAGSQAVGYRPGTLQVLGQAGQSALQSYQGTFDQQLQNMLRQQQMADLQRKRQAEANRQAALQQLTQRPELTEEQRLGISAFPEMAKDVLFPKPEEAKVLKPGEALIKDGEIVFQLEKPDEPVKYDRVDLGNSVAFVHPTTLQTVKVIPKARDPKDTSAGEDTVRKEFFGQAKPYIEISQAYRKIEEATKIPSAAGDVSLIFAFMKILDPGSVVREGEFATAQNAGGIPDRIRAQYNAAVDGQRLAPAQRQDFLNQAKNLARSQKQMFENQLVPFYSNIAQERGYDVNKVVSNPFEGLDLSAQPLKPAGRPGPIRQTQEEKSLINKFLTPRQ